MKLVWIEIQNHNMNMHTCKVCKWYWPRKHNQGSHSETPGHRAGRSWQELYEILQGKLWSPPQRKEEPLAMIEWRLSSWGEDLQKGPGSPREQPADCKSAMHLGKKKSLLSCMNGNIASWWKNWLFSFCQYFLDSMWNIVSSFGPSKQGRCV